MGASYHRGASKQDYQTPPEFMDAVRDAFGPIYFDLAADPYNAQADRYYTAEQNSLLQDWHKIVVPQGQWLWLNPPYDSISQWAYKCHEEAQKGARILFLVPASVGSNWYRDYVHNKAIPCFLNKRIQFVGAKYPYPKDLMLVEYISSLDCVNYAPIMWDWKENTFY